jgi:CO/xanthine dehydrogenase Mo-binding subunit
MDPVEIRKINMIKQGETSPIFRIMGEGREGTDTIINSCKLEYCISRGMELIRWKEKYPCRKISANKVRSVGMAIAMQGSAIANYDMASAAIKLNDDGFFNLTVGATDLGTGSDTILAQIAADELEVPTEKIIVYSSDTDLTPFDKGAYASSTTYASGNAVKKAAEKIKESIMAKAAEYFKCGISQIKYCEGVVYGPDNRQITLKELSTIIYYSGSQEQIYSCASYVPTVSPPPYMAGFVEVETDLLTGKVEVIEYVAVVDCGTPINPNLAKVQVEGALVQGIGMALYEQVIKSRSGKLLSDSMMTYHIPSRKDIGKITVEFAESYEPSGPFGAKSVGEIGIDTPPAAIANAIFNGTGKRIRKLPITPEDIIFFKEKHE